MSFHVPENRRVENGPLASKSSYKNNGLFKIKVNDKTFFAIASDGQGWEHVSVAPRDEERTATWEEMCIVKSIFWDAEDCVVQYHPPESEYVNNAEYVLHLWRPVDTPFPTPDSLLVGYK